MSKRRINKQQSTRIQQQQASYYSNKSPLKDTTEADSSLTQPGLVITRFGRDAEIETQDKQRIRCSIRPHLESVVAGDQIIWQATGPDQGVIVSCCPRQSVLGRPNYRGEYRPVAANITQLLIVVAPKPEISWLLLDSYLVMAELLKLKARIILNKADLPHEAIKSELMSDYATLGYPVLFTSKKNEQSYKELTHILNNQISVFVGQSGVGKSSLISHVLPDEAIQISNISIASELGRHTTSNSKLYHLSEGGALIDSPGVRSFGLWEASKQDIIYGFLEFRALAALCKFSNCNHVKTPGCAIEDAIINRKVSAKRFERLISLLEKAK